MTHAVLESSQPIASDSQRVLVIGGILLAASGMLFGDIFAMFILHLSMANSQSRPLSEGETIRDNASPIGSC